MGEKARLTLDLDARLHRQLKMLAAQKGVSMREFCLEAIEHRITEHAAGEARASYLTPAEAPLLAELWDNEEDAIYDDV